VEELRPEIPEEIARAVERALEKNLHRRYQSVAELAGAIAPCVDDRRAFERIDAVLRAGKSRASELDSDDGEDPGSEDTDTFSAVGPTKLQPIALPPPAPPAIAEADIPIGEEHAKQKTTLPLPATSATVPLIAGPRTPRSPPRRVADATPAPPRSMGTFVAIVSAGIVLIGVVVFVVARPGSRPVPQAAASSEPSTPPLTSSPASSPPTDATSTAATAAALPAPPADLPSSTPRTTTTAAATTHTSRAAIKPKPQQPPASPARAAPSTSKSAGSAYDHF
jgi:hypothetical protein